MRNDTNSPNVQREMAMLGVVKQPVFVHRDLIEVCKNRLDAIILCVQLSRLTHEAVCERLGIDKGHWSRIMSGHAWFPDPKANDLMRICGNFAPLQFEAWSNGFDLVAASKGARIKELEAQLEELKKSA